MKKGNLNEIKASIAIKHIEGGGDLQEGEAIGDSKIGGNHDKGIMLQS